MILAHDALAELSGYRQRARQIQWLERQGIPYAIGADGYPRTTLGLVETGLSGQTRATEPNWGALNGPKQKNRKATTAARLS